MFNFLVAATPDLDAVQAYFESIPSFVSAFYTFLGFFLGVLVSAFINCIDDLLRFIKRFVLKKRLDNSSKELMEYVDKVINRDTVDIDSPEQTGNNIKKSYIKKGSM